MSPRSEKEFHKIRQARSAALLDAALELFANQGYHATSIEQIARNAGVSKGLTYNYFTGKEHILESVFLRFVEELEHEFQVFWHHAQPADLHRQFIEESFSVAVNNKERWRLYMGLIMQPSIPESIRESFTSFFRRALKNVEKYLHKAGVKNAKAESWLLSATLDGIFLYYLIDEKHCPLEKIKSILFERYKTVFENANT